MSDQEVLAMLDYASHVIDHATVLAGGRQDVVYTDGLAAIIGPIEYTIKPGDILEVWSRAWAFIAAYRINGGPLVKARYWPGGAEGHGEAHDA